MKSTHKSVDYYDRAALNLYYPQSWEQIVEEKASEVWENIIDASPTLAANGRLACVIGGQPGAGKSHSLDIVLEQFAGNALFVSMDDYRHEHPQYATIYKEQGENYADYTRKFASNMADKILEKTIKHRFNIVYESTLGNYEKVAKLLNTLKSNQYECNIIVVACPAEISYQSTKNRMDKDRAAGKEPRSVPTDIHDKIIRSLAGNVQLLCNNFKDISITIQTRDGIELWSRENTHDEQPFDVMNTALKLHEYELAHPNKYKANDIEF